MKRQTAVQAKESAPAKKSSFSWLRSAAAHPTAEAEHEAPSASSPAFAHDFTKVPVRPMQLPGVPGFSCPFAPQRCPSGGACHTCPPKMQAKLKIGQPGDKYEQEADRVAETVMRMPEPQVQRKCSAPGCKDEDEDKLVQTKSAGSAGNAQVDHPLIQNVLASPGQPLDAGTRSFMEPRFGQDFSGVRVHLGGEAAESARAVNARAYTVGRDVVFGEGQYARGSDEGRRLMAHELTHVVQQWRNSIIAQPVIQRVAFFESIARFFGGGTFSDEELHDYLIFLSDNKRIENDYDSDNKAREVVTRWKHGNSIFSTLTVPLRVLLIQEMASGYLSSSDQEGILDLLDESIRSERTTIIAEININSLRTRFDGENGRKLNQLLDQQEEDESIAALSSNWNTDGVLEILHRHGDEHIIQTILDKSIKVIRFETAFDKWKYSDGHIEENEITGLRGNRHGSEIRIRKSLSSEEAAATLFHEVSHYTSTQSDYLEQEVEVRATTEEFRIRHGLPETRQGYRNQNGAVNEQLIRDEIKNSPHYNPTGRTRIGRRYVGEKEVGGWRLP